jgi:hypothetical protein
MSNCSIPVPGTRTRGPVVSRPGTPAPALYPCMYGCEPGRSETPRELSPAALLAEPVPFPDGCIPAMAPGDIHGAWKVIAVKLAKATFDDIKAGIAIDGKVSRYDLECACGTIAKSRINPRSSRRCAHCRTIENYATPLFKMFSIFAHLYYAVITDNPSTGLSRITEIGYRYYDGALDISTGYYIEWDSEGVAA